MGCAWPPASGGVVEAAGLSAVPTVFAAAALEDPDAPEFTTVPGPAVSRAQGDFDPTSGWGLHSYEPCFFGSGFHPNPTDAERQQINPVQAAMHYRGFGTASYRCVAMLSWLRNFTDECKLCLLPGLSLPISYIARRFVMQC